MADMYILSPDEEVLTVLSSDGQEACKFWDAKYKEELNKGSSFSFVADASHPDARYLVEENQVIFKDKDGLLKLFVIKELDDADENAEINTLVTCEAAMMELAETFVKDFRPTEKTAQYVLDRVLSRSRWEAEVTAALGTNSTTFYKKSALECISEVLNLWGGELQDYIEFEGNKITRRVLKILPRRGKDSGKRFEIDKDTEKISRTVISYPLTALWGYGASIPSTDENGEETGGYTRFIDFSEVEWKKSEGDPVDKPLGQEWVGDPDLLKRFGRLKNGERIHREGQFSNEDITDPKELLKATYNHLITEASKIEVNYELSVQLLQNVPGYEHEHVELGDTTIAIDRNFAIPIETKQRIISMEYDITDPDNTCVVEIGQFLSVLQKDDRIQKIQDTIDRNRGKWDSGGEVTDGSFPDTVPPVPSNVKIESLFQGVSISWDYNPSSYIAAYEVYASPVKGFTPLPENRIFWGKGSKCEHSPGVDQVWYYRLRAINTHKTPSEFTPEFTGVTRRILTDDILFGSITADLLADLAVKADKISRDFEDANILPGSILNAPDIYTVNAKRSVNYAVNGFNEVTVTKNSTSYSYFGITTRGRPTLALTKDQVYTLSFELKRLTTKNFSYIRLLTESGASYDISNNLSDISSYPTDEFVRFDVVFTAPATFSDGRLGIGGRTVNNGDSAEFVLRKLQIRRGDVRKDFGFSPYDTQLTDGVITSQYVQDAAIVSAKIADAAITSAKIAEAAVGSAAIQNAAIKRAHLETAIIGTAQIEDGAITNAKIANLSADKINAGTIKGITIEGSLIRGARIEPLSSSSAYKSYIEANKIYQLRKTIYDGRQKRYEELDISSGSIIQDYGNRLDDESHESLNKVEISKGKVSLSSGKTFDSGDTSRMEFYSELGTLDNGLSGGNFIRMYRNSEKVFELQQDSFTDDNNVIVPRMSIRAEKVDFVSFFEDVSVYSERSIHHSADRSLAFFAKDGPLAVYAKGGIKLNRGRDGEYTTSITADDALKIASKGTLTLTDTEFNGASFSVGKDSNGPRVWSREIYSRTYSSSANVHITEHGTLGRITSASKYKLNIEEYPEDKREKVLNLIPKTWYDKKAVEEYANILSEGNEEDALNENDIPHLERIPGLIAEDVYNAGLKEFVSFGPPDKDGNREIEGLMYDRIYALLIPIVKDLKTRIENIESTLN